MESNFHTDDCKANKSQVGECRGCAEDSISAIFDAVAKNKRMGLIGEYNEALCFIAKAAKK